MAPFSRIPVCFPWVQSRWWFPHLHSLLTSQCIRDYITCILSSNLRTLWLRSYITSILQMRKLRHGKPKFLPGSLNGSTVVLGLKWHLAQSLESRVNKWMCSVVSNSWQSYGLWPPRLLCPWDFLGKILNGLPFPSWDPWDLSDPGIEPVSPALAGILYHWATRMLLVNKWICGPSSKAHALSVYGFVLALVVPMPDISMTFTSVSLPLSPGLLHGSAHEGILTPENLLPEAPLWEQYWARVSVWCSGLWHGGQSQSSEPWVTRGTHSEGWPWGARAPFPPWPRWGW